MWKYYNHAMIPATAPHEIPDLKPLQDGSIWKCKEGFPLFARWTTDYDCGYETEWWYCIKDEPFDISTLKSKRRSVINKGKKNFYIKEIDPIDYKEDIIRIQLKAWNNYPKSYRPQNKNVDYLFDKMKQKEKEIRTFGAFGIEDKKLHAFSCIEEHINWANLFVLKSDPLYENLQVNASLIAGICEFYNSKFVKGFYLCDGERNIVHVTRFQDYLCKYFGFRKAYCYLNIKYRPGVRCIINLIFPFRNILNKKFLNNLFYKVNAVMRMEEIIRNQG